MHDKLKCVSILDNLSADARKNLFEKNKEGYYQVPSHSPEDRNYQNSMNLLKSLESDYDSTATPLLKIAILDTGILPEHPVFKRYIKNYVDFTGEGIEDGNGHGSLVTWLYLTSEEHYQNPSNIGLYICKILSNDGKGKAENIIKGIKWAESQHVRLINLSAGIDNRRWLGLWDCKTTCDVCKTALNLGDKVMLFAAAGNNGHTVCPAKVGLQEGNTSVVAVGATKVDSNEAESWSGTGNIYTNGTTRISGTISIQ